MTPIENPNTTNVSERDAKMQSEIKAFLECGCEWAEMWADENVVPQRNVQLYYKNARQMRVTNEIEFCNKKHKTLAHRKEKK